MVPILSLNAGSSVRYIPGAVFGVGLLVCTCISILVFWLRLRKRQQSSGRRLYSTTRQRRRRSAQNTQSHRRAPAPGRRLIVLPQPSPFANPNAPPPYAPSAGPPSSEPPPYTARTATNSIQPRPQAQQLPLTFADDPPPYLSPPAYDPERQIHQWSIRAEK